MYCPQCNSELPDDSCYCPECGASDARTLEDMPVQCYRLSGEGADTLAEGDTITVTGLLKNYKGTVEFDKGCTLDAVVK